MGSTLPKMKVLPTPTGRFGVGCADLMAKLSSVGEETVPGVFVRIFYPAEVYELKKNGVEDFPHWIPRSEYSHGYVKAGWALDPIFGASWFRMLNWFIGKVLLPCKWHAKAPYSSKKFPVVIFSHGTGGMRTTYSTFCCELSSHGYVVAAIEHRDATACWSYTIDEQKEMKSGCISQNEIPVYHEQVDPDEKEFEIRNCQLKVRVNECLCTLKLLERLNQGNLNGSDLTTDNETVSILEDNGFDWLQLKDRLDLDRVSIAGHSFGGSTALCAASQCHKFKACLVLDGWMFPLKEEIYSKVKQPILFVNTGNFQTVESLTQMRKFFSANAQPTVLTIKDSVHQNDTDFPFLVSGWIARKLEMQGTIDPLFFNKINTKATLCFLNSTFGAIDNEDQQSLPELITEFKEYLIQE